VKLTDRDRGYFRVMRAVDGSRQGRRLRVGVKADPHTEMVASVQEFGTQDGRVPERSYLRAWFDKNRDRINDHLRVVAVKSLMTDRSRDELLTELGHQYRDEIQAEILFGIRPELAESTLKAKLRRGDPATPLVTVQNNLLNAIVAMLDGEIV
jgi:hypothetical protein